MHCQSVEQRGPARNLALFKETLAYNSFGTSETREQLGQLVDGGFDASKASQKYRNNFSILLGVNGKQAAEFSKDARYQFCRKAFFREWGWLKRV